MFLIGLGATLVICGVVVAAFRTANNGRLSATSSRRRANAGTLEPRGRGARLSLWSDLPGVIMVGVGAVLLIAGALI